MKADTVSVRTSYGPGGGMRANLGYGLALLGVAGAVFALAPGEIERHKPPVPAASDGGGALVVDLVDGASLADLEAVERTIGADLDWVHPLAVDEALATGIV